MKLFKENTKLDNKIEYVLVKKELIKAACFIPRTLLLFNDRRFYDDFINNPKRKKKDTLLDLFFTYQEFDRNDNRTDDYMETNIDIYGTATIIGISEISMDERDDYKTKEELKYYTDRYKYIYDYLDHSIHIAKDYIDKLEESETYFGLEVDDVNQFSSKFGEQVEFINIYTKRYDSETGKWIEAINGYKYYVWKDKENKYYLVETRDEDDDMLCVDEIISEKKFISEFLRDDKDYKANKFIESIATSGYLTPTEYRIIMLLLIQDESQTDLSEKLKIEHRNINTAVNRLLNTELIKKSQIIKKRVYYTLNIK